VGVALDVYETGKCSYFVIPTMEDYSSVLRKAVTKTLAFFLFI
jgi:hypothetical protein